MRFGLLNRLSYLSLCKLRLPYFSHLPTNEFFEGGVSRYNTLSGMQVRVVLYFLLGGIQVAEGVIWSSLKEQTLET